MPSHKCEFTLFPPQGLIDLSKEEERIRKQVGTAEQQLKRLKDAMEKADYAEKVPTEVQELNSAKLKTLEGEIEQLGQGLESVKLMLSES